MSEDEIRVPRGVRDVMPDWAKPTVLGMLQGARRQYRYGNLHIREYAGEYAIHTDAVDPRKDKLGHLLRDAPEVLAGLGCGLAAGVLAYKAVTTVPCGGSEKKCSGTASALVTAAAAAFVSGCASYVAAREIKRHVSGLCTEGREQDRRRPRLWR